MKKRLLLLALIGALYFTSTQSANADAGGACLGQWSECRSNCESLWNLPSEGVYLALCYNGCGSQLDACLAH